MIGRTPHIHQNDLLHIENQLKWSKLSGDFRILGFLGPKKLKNDLQNGLVYSKEDFKGK